MENKIIVVEDSPVSFKVAKILKENGFAYSSNSNLNNMYINKEGGENTYTLFKHTGNNLSNPDNVYDAPSHDLVKKWIEVNFHFHISTSPRSWEENIVKWSVWIDELKLHCFMLAAENEDGDDRQDDPYDTKEEGIEVAILFIFRHLKNHFEKLYIKEGKNK